MQGEIKNAHQLTEPGYYWWRFSPFDAWRPEKLDPINEPAVIRIMGGEFIGPIPMPGVQDG